MIVTQTLFPGKQPHDITRTLAAYSALIFLKGTAERLVSRRPKSRLDKGFLCSCTINKDEEFAKKPWELGVALRLCKEVENGDEMS